MLLEAPRRARQRLPGCNGTSIWWLCQYWWPALRRCPEQAGETACQASRLQRERRMQKQEREYQRGIRGHTGTITVLTWCECKPVLTQLTVFLSAVFEPLQQTGESQGEQVTLFTPSLWLSWLSTAQTAMAPAHIHVSSYIIINTALMYQRKGAHVQETNEMMTERTIPDG